MIPGRWQITILAIRGRGGWRALASGLFDGSLRLVFVHVGRNDENGGDARQGRRENGRADRESAVAGGWRWGLRGGRWFVHAKIMQNCF